jgi:hypothetical protein
LVELIGTNQVEEIEVKAAEKRVCHLGGKHSFSLQYVVQVGLGDAGETGETAFGSHAGTDAVAEVVEKSLLEVFEGHNLGPGLFLGEIGCKHFTLYL